MLDSIEGRTCTCCWQLAKKELFPATTASLYVLCPYTNRPMSVAISDSTPMMLPITCRLRYLQYMLDSHDGSLCVPSEDEAKLLGTDVGGFSVWFCGRGDGNGSIGGGSAVERSESSIDGTVGFVWDSVSETAGDGEGDVSLLPASAELNVSKELVEEVWPCSEWTVVGDRMCVGELLDSIL